MTRDQTLAVVDAHLASARELLRTLDVGNDQTKYSPRSYRARVDRELQDASTQLDWLRRSFA